MLLSVIIPAYNACKTIEHCLDSIYTIGLPEQEFEVIVIDDCSQDNTVAVIDEYAKQHTNITLLRQPKNQRQGAARNRGISIAQGKYIAFVDADDEMVASGIMNALHGVKKSNVDICYYDFEYEMPKGIWHKWSKPEDIQNKSLSSFDFLNDYYTCDYNAPWRTIYRTEFLKASNILFVEGVRWEDCDWTVKVYATANEIQFVDGVGYRYQYGENATSRQKTIQAMYERVLAGVRLLKFSEECRIPGLQKTLHKEAMHAYINAELRIRSLTKYKFVDIKNLLNKFKLDELAYISQHTTKWLRFLTTNLICSQSILFFACPIAAMGRKLMQLKRKLL